MLLTGCTGGLGTPKAAAAQGWMDPTVNAVSRPVSGNGITAVTALRPDGTLETVVFDLARGRRLWARPATMVGRLSGMGVQPPAISGRPSVVALEPRRTGRWRATLVARDARTAAEQWTRPVDSTFGPVRCGAQLCLSEFTARKDARFAALDPATGRTLWKVPGIAEVEWADDRRTVLFRMARHPVLEARDPRTGRVQWSFPVERAVGPGVNLSGGWTFGSLGDVLVGYLAPYQADKGRPLSAFGFFGLRMTDGRPLWARKRLLRVYPSANPAVALLTREVDAHGTYGAFAQLDPRTGQTIVAVPPGGAPKTPWWLAFPADLTRLGFLSQNHPGSAYDLRRPAASQTPAHVEPSRPPHGQAPSHPAGSQHRQATPSTAPGQRRPAGTAPTTPAQQHPGGNASAPAQQRPGGNASASAQQRPGGSASTPAQQGPDGVASQRRPAGSASATPQRGRRPRTPAATPRPAVPTASPAPVNGLRTWSFCTVNPAELKITGQRGFFPIAPLCAYDLGTGKPIANPGPPPAWYTGAVDGWRVWRDERGTLHAVHDAKGTAPGMYGS